MSASDRVLVASDAHMGAAPADQQQAFLQWLERAAEADSRLILNGDVFDFWFEYRRGTTRGHERTLDLLRRLVAAGTPVTLVGGNHDWWGGRYLRDEVGVEFLQEPVVRDMAGKRTFLAHGDGLGNGDVGYRVLSRVLRAKLTRRVFGALPPALGDGLARSVSRTGSKWDEWGAHQEARSNALQAWGEAKLVADGELDLVVLGHTHRPVLREVRPGAWYVNTGDWVVHKSYLTLEPGREPLLREWRGERP
jgi:UDP-2,3-diacylglucosamine hydrolase